jgi:hypothetical protein
LGKAAVSSGDMLWTATTKAMLSRYAVLPYPRRRLILAHLEYAAGSLDFAAGTPSGDKGTRGGNVRAYRTLSAVELACAGTPSARTALAGLISWLKVNDMMKALIAPAGFALALALGLSACSNPYDPGQRAVGGGLMGAGAGAAIGGAAGGGKGAAIGAASGGALGAVGGAATTPPPPPPQYRY